MTAMTQGNRRCHCFKSLGQLFLFEVRAMYPPKPCSCIVVNYFVTGKKHSDAEDLAHFKRQWRYNDASVADTPKMSLRMTLHSGT